MTECKYYGKLSKPLRDDRISKSRSGAPRGVATFCWCEHPKHSPVDKFEATKTLGAGHRLKCEGQLEKCDISDKFDDIY